MRFRAAVRLRASLVGIALAGVVLSAGTAVAPATRPPVPPGPVLAATAQAAGPPPAGPAGAAVALAASGSPPANAAPPRRVGTAPTPPAGSTLLGALPATSAIQATVTLNPGDPGALAGYATAVSTPGNPLYRHYLTPAGFAAQFGPTAAQISAVEDALVNDGLDPSPVSADHLAIRVSGTAGRFSQVFDTGFDRYRLASGRVAYANTEAPEVAGSVAGAVQGVIGLDDLVLEQHEDLAAPASPDAADAPDAANAPAHGTRARSRTPAAGTRAGPGDQARGTPSGSARPRATPAPDVVTGGPQPCSSASAVESTYDAYTADQLASAYGFSSLYGAGDLGAGQTIALFELEPNLASDISTFQSCYGTNAQVGYVKVDGGAGTGDGSGEAALDIEVSIGEAPKAAEIVYQGPNSGSGAYDTYNAIIGQDRAAVVSTSWGLCESSEGSSAAASEDTLFQEAATQGQTILSAAGDDGSEGCGRRTLAVDDPAGQPYVTGVGGTKLSALGPPPTETVWNESATHEGAGGGGISALWAMPSYQSDAATGLDVVNAHSSGSACHAAAGSYCREVPDVSADADPYTAYVDYYDGAWTAFGGTSAATPLWAALIALTNASSACSGRYVGFANPALYAIAGSTSYPGDFHDITSGENDYTGTNGGLYPAGAGYDMASGLGTPDGGPLSVDLCDASALTPPPIPALDSYPSWLNGDVEGVRDAGTDATFPMMQTLGDLYTGAGLDGCTLAGTGSSAESACSTSADANVPTTDIEDNYDRTEVTEGVDDVGSAAGQGQLCGTVGSPLPVALARSTAPIGPVGGCNLVGTGFAKDSVPVIDFPTVDPGAVGAVVPTDLPWSAAAQSAANEAANGGQAVVGPVAEGWLPGDPIGCTPNTSDTYPTPSGDCSGYPLANVTDNDSGGGAGSVAYRIWCATDSTRITDWGQLTNLSAGGPGNGGVARALGGGAPIGVPIRVVGVTPGASTNLTFAGFAQSGDTEGNCDGTNASDVDAAADPNPATAPSPDTPPLAPENDASGLGAFAASDFPDDPADQAVELATSLYYESNGTYATSDYADVASLTPGTAAVPPGVPGAYVGNELEENGVTVTIPHELANTYPTARTLFNVYDTATLRASTAGFVDWLCDSQDAIRKEPDEETGIGFDQEITTAIQNDYGFSRLTDTTRELANTAIVPADGLAAPNGTCAAGTSGMTTGSSAPTVSVTSGSTTVTLSSGSFPPAITGGTAVADPVPGGTSVIPPGDTVVSNNGSTLTLTTAATGTAAAATLTFPGVDAVTEVAEPGS